ncbi:hypothetical protein [Halomarina oriensis]|uniref:Uncharacterized protein n=1 Tax=Halomarina oriensis TaxID=671145 RepID=A0A6B0GQW4_9EURY|nr:hypothetical protein [Halomarina oriensis]MWG35053.1 hypothetical protein [Halomarina oriensis]
MTRLFEYTPSVRRGVGAVGAAGRVLLAATALFAAMSLYGWRRGMVGQALNIGLLAAAFFCTFLLLLLVRGWVGPWLLHRVRMTADER